MDSQKHKYSVTDLQTKQISNQIANLKVRDRNIEVRIILLEKIEEDKKMKDKMVKFLVADESGSIHANFFGESAYDLKEGDIVYMNGCYTGVFKSKMILYQGKQNVTYKIGEYFFRWKELPNLSLIDITNNEDEKKIGDN